MGGRARPPPASTRWARDHGRPASVRGHVARVTGTGNEKRARAIDVQAVGTAGTSVSRDGNSTERGWARAARRVEDRGTEVRRSWNALGRGQGDGGRFTGAWSRGLGCPALRRGRRGRRDRYDRDAGLARAHHPGAWAWTIGRGGGGWLGGPRHRIIEARRVEEGPVAGEIGADGHMSTATGPRLSGHAQDEPQECEGHSSSRPYQSRMRPEHHRDSARWPRVSAREVLDPIGSRGIRVLMRLQCAAPAGKDRRRASDTLGRRSSPTTVDRTAVWIVRPGAPPSQTISDGRSRHASMSAMNTRQRGRDGALVIFHCPGGQEARGCSGRSGRTTIGDHP